jgi:dTDP-4-dehydrorhamnose reductase
VKILVLGAGGQLGAAIVQGFSSWADVVALDRAALDITDKRAVRARIAAERPAVVVNCAAYNRVDAAEAEPSVAMAVNALGVRALARAASEGGSTLVHYGSDFVFDGRTDRPYVESDRPNPQSAYAASKLLGEWFAADVPSHYVLRVESLFGGAPGGPLRGSVAAICAGLRAGAEVPVFVDRTVSPTYVPDAVEATRAILERRLPAGLYHCVNSGHCTWLALAEEAAQLLGVEPRLKPVTLEGLKLAAARPKYCALSNAKLAGFGVTLPDWRDALHRALQDVSGAPSS